MTVLFWIVGTIAYLGVGVACVRLSVRVGWLTPDTRSEWRGLDYFGASGVALLWPMWLAGVVVFGSMYLLGKFAVKR